MGRKDGLEVPLSSFPGQISELPSLHLGVSGWIEASRGNAPGATRLDQGRILISYTPVSRYVAQDRTHSLTLIPYYAWPNSRQLKAMARPLPRPKCPHSHALTIKEWKRGEPGAWGLNYESRQKTGAAPSYSKRSFDFLSQGLDRASSEVDLR